MFLEKFCYQIKYTVFLVSIFNLVILQFKQSFFLLTLYATRFKVIDQIFNNYLVDLELEPFFVAANLLFVSQILTILRKYH